MGDPQEYYNRFRLLECCVIIPTYNNHRTLQRVIDGVLEYTDAVIVVNDGSTDTTPQILERYPDITQVTHEVNKGKGMALRTGLKTAKDLGFTYAITIDSDGQHFPDDLPVFLSAIENEGEALLIGSRNMEQEGVPKKSSFGALVFVTQVSLPIGAISSNALQLPAICLRNSGFSVPSRLGFSRLIARDSIPSIPYTAQAAPAISSMTPHSFFTLCMPASKRTGFSIQR